MRILLVSLLVALGPLVPAHADEADPPDPPLETSRADLEAALECPDVFDDTAHEPLLLVHGTFTNGWENWGWNWQPALSDAGWDVCTVTLPNRSLGDMQIQAEYVVSAILQMAGESKERVDVLGHSQGGLHPRWAVKWWPDVRALVDDLVTLGTPNHGTSLSAVESPLGCFASCWQMGPTSQYLSALNAGDENPGDETPGDVSYTNVFTLFDELVRPQFPESTSALDGASNVAVQDVCPGRPVDHVGLAADRATHEIVMDALVNPGPADPARINRFSACSGAFFGGVNPVRHGATIFQRSVDEGFPGFQRFAEEPALKPYAQG